MAGFRFRCECGAEFDRPKMVSEYRGEFWGTPAYEDMWYCPVCGSDCFDEVKDSDDEETED